MRVADPDVTIYHLGGMGKIKAMIGAYNFVFDKDGAVYFRFGLSGKTNMVKISLNDSDLYVMTFYLFSKKSGSLRTVKIFEDIYAEDLRERFEKFTGLYLRL